MLSATATTCGKHVWERHLEVHNRLERVVRVCVQCGCQEVCWAQPPVRRRLQPARASLVVFSEPEANPSLGPGLDGCELVEQLRQKKFFIISS